MGKEGGANGAMGRGEHPADGPGKAVNGSETGVGESQAAKEAGQGHVLARRGVAAVGASGTQRPRRAADAFDAQRIHHWVGPAADEGFNQLRQRVQAGRSRDFPRQVVGQLRVHQRNLGQHEGAAQADFDAVLGGGQDGVTSDLGAGAGGGGDRNERQAGARQALAAADDFQVIQDVAGVSGHGGDGFSGVERAAAAKGDHPLGRHLASLVNTGSDGFDFRLARHAESFGRDALVGEGRA